MRKYDVDVALRVTDATKKNMVGALKKIFNTFTTVLSTEVRSDVRKLLKDVLNIDETRDIRDEDWIKAVDLYYLFKEFFRLRRAWINSNIGSDFFDLYAIIDGD